MIELLEVFIKYIPNFISLSPGEMIPYFMYFYTQKGEEVIAPKMIGDCYEKLSLVPYSNISAYLSNKSSGRNAIYLRKKTGYSLTRQYRDHLAKSLSFEIELNPTNELIDLTILDGAPYYLKKIANQMSCCYDNGLYDACLVMMRKLFETLVIECYERYSCVSEIKDVNGNFYYLRDLIPLYLSSTHWSVSRNFEKHIKAIKKYGDLSAHNRRFFAKKSEVDSFRFDMRQCLQEILLTIDYSNWDRNAHLV